ncbi:phosphoglycerate mutase-like protein [Imleria badia]|nr:phosphoglycerate mutase-like protein [Imleria badia]
MRGKERAQSVQHLLNQFKWALPTQIPFKLVGAMNTFRNLGAVHGQSESHHKNYKNLATLSPYHDAPNVPGVSVNLPDDCTVDQVLVLHRHGSRGPVFEQQFILGLVETLDSARDIIQSTPLPPNLQFLREGYEYQLVPQELTVVGRRELFDHGAEFALRYPNFSTNVVVSSPVQRVVESSYFFANGFFGLKTENVTFRTVTDLDDPVSWITPWKSCPRFSDHQSHRAASQWAAKYVPPIAQKLGNLVPGINISVNDTRGALYACPFDLAARNQSPWCNVFSTHELQNLEYEYDLLMDGASGHASRGDAGPLLGAFYVKKLIERLTNATGDAKPLYLEFGHDTSILLPLSTMGLNKDTLPLSPRRAPVHRRFRTSQQTPFAASMVWEKFTCKKSFEGPQVRLVLNGATFPLFICENSMEDKIYGTCSLAEFARVNEYSANMQYKSESWNTTCEIDD